MSYHWLWRLALCGPLTTIEFGVLGVLSLAEKVSDIPGAERSQVQLSWGGERGRVAMRINYRVLVRLEFVSRTWALSRNVKMFSIISIKITYLSIIIDIILLRISNGTNHEPMDWKIIRRAPHHRQVWWDQSCPGLAAGGDSSWQRWRCCLSRGAGEARLR